MIMHYPFRTHRTILNWGFIEAINKINDRTVTIRMSSGEDTFSPGTLWVQHPEFNMFEDGTQVVYEGFLNFYALKARVELGGKETFLRFANQEYYTDSSESGSEGKTTSHGWRYMAGLGSFPRVLDLTKLI